MRRLAWLLVAFVFFSGGRLVAQGCIVARSCGPNIAPACAHDAGNMSSAYVAGHSPGGGLFASGHWVLTVDYRQQNSHRHFVGTQEQVIRQEQGTQVVNNLSVLDLNATYEFNPRWSLDLDLPVIKAQRIIPGRLFQLRGSTQQTEVFHAGGIGDAIVSANMWLLRTPASTSQNLAFSFGVKLPTGKDDVTNRLITPKGVQTMTADQSIQLGDGGWGLVVGSQAYKRIKSSTLYFAGSYLANPRNTNGVFTGRSSGPESVMSVADQYLARAGVSHAVPLIPGMTASFGFRKEGVPVRDLFGKSDGFRRPGYAFSAEPGLIWTQERGVWNLNVPIALRRNRLRSVADYINNSHGDAAFADALVLMSYTRRF